MSNTDPLWLVRVVSKDCTKRCDWSYVVHAKDKQQAEQRVRDAHQQPGCTIMCRKVTAIEAKAIPKNIIRI